MKNSTLYIIWAALYVACAGLGVFNAPDWLGVLGCIGFFVPPAVILWQAGQKKDRKNLLTVRNLALAWLGVTLVLLILNILSVAMTEIAGTVLYYLMVVLCSPMVCGQIWIISLFLWACLLMASLKLLKK